MPVATRVAVVVLALTSAVGGTLALAPTASAAAPVITVTPDTGLHNTDVVTVSARGLPGNSSFDIAECQLAVMKANPANPGPGCSPDAANEMTSPSGRIAPTHLTIHTGQLGSDPGSVCGATTNGKCGIVVATHGFGAVFGTVTIIFAGGSASPAVSTTASKTTVPAGKRFTVSGRSLAYGTAVNGLKVSVYARSNSHHAWAKVSRATMKTKTIKGKAGSYAFKLKGLRHSEQYQVRHPKQRVQHTTYKPAKGKTITIHP